MIYKFSLSTISSLIDCLQTYDKVEGVTPEQFVKEHLSDKELEAEIFENLCNRRDSIELLLKTTFLKPNPQLVVHLFLAMFLLIEATGSIIYESMKRQFSDDVINVLFGLIDDDQCEMLLETSPNEYGVKDTDEKKVHRNANEIKNLSLRLAEPDCITHWTSATSIKVTTSEKDNKLSATNDNIVSENKLNEIVLKLPEKETKKSCDIQFKKNTASILRAGSLLKTNIKMKNLMIEKLASGSNDPSEIRNKLKAVAEVTQDEELEDIQRKHLIGLISLEEAKIAKLEMVKRNQRSAEEIKLESQNLYEQLKKIKENRIYNSKEVIRKTHLGRLISIKNQFDVVEKKKMNAKGVKQLNNKLLKQANDANEKNLQDKTRLIQKMKKLDNKLKVGKIEQKKKLLELKKSLASFHKKIDLEKESQQLRIQQERDRQKQLVESTERLLDVRHKFSPPKPEESI